MPYLGPLPPDTHPDLKETFATYQRLLGYTPSTILIMQRRPRLVKALAQMASAVWDPAGEVDTGLKRLLAYMASRTHGCAYSMAHSAEAAHRAGVSDEKIAAILDYRTSPLFTDAERVAIEFAVAAASQPNAVTEAHFVRMRRHWNEGQIVEIAGVVALNGFLNRWNDTMAPQLEREPLAFATAHLAAQGWKPGKHQG
jgi:alkylhydroperoxidase family enzyme